MWDCSVEDCPYSSELMSRSSSPAEKWLELPQEEASLCSLESFSHSWWHHQAWSACYSKKWRSCFKETPSSCRADFSIDWDLMSSNGWHLALLNISQVSSLPSHAGICYTKLYPSGLEPSGSANRWPQGLRLTERLCFSSPSYVKVWHYYWSTASTVA